jgi:hypothetical protein
LLLLLKPSAKWIIANVLGEPFPISPYECSLFIEMPLYSWCSYP